MKSFLFQTEWRAALFLSTVRFVFCAYRAAHQSITIDEAYTYNQFLHGSWWDIWNRYEANDHVLFSILAKFSIQLFGFSDFALRLPTLIAGFFLMLGVYKVLKVSTHSRVVRWVAFLALALHPLLLDFSIAARGYGLALALLVWAIYFTMRRWDGAAGLTLGLALSANLVMLFPALGVLFAAAIVSRGSLSDRIRDFAVMLAPCETVFAAICFGAIKNATRANFYVGEPELREALHQLVYFSVHVSHASGLLGTERRAGVIQYVFVPLIALFLLAGFWAVVRRGRKQWTRLVPFFAIAVTVACIFAARYWFAVNYPVDRLGLHLFVLLGVTWAIAADAIPRLRALSVVLGLLFVVQFATQLHGGYFTAWVEDRYDKDIAEQIQTLSAGKPDHSVTVSTSWFHQSTIEYYRVQMHMTQLQPLAWNPTPVLEGHDFYVLGDQDMSLARGKPIRILYSDEHILLGASR